MLSGPIESREVVRSGRAGCATRGGWPLDVPGVRAPRGRSACVGSLRVRGAARAAVRGVRVCVAGEGEAALLRCPCKLRVLRRWAGGRFQSTTRCRQGPICAFAVRARTPISGGRVGVGACVSNECTQGVVRGGDEGGEELRTK